MIQFNFKYLYVIPLIFIISCGNPVRKENLERKKSKDRINLAQYDSLIEKGDEDDKIDIIEELDEYEIPDGALLLIRLLFDENKDVQKKAQSILDNYRRFVLADLDKSFLGHLDQWFRRNPIYILKHLGYEKQYKSFIENEEARGRRVGYYKKNPLRYVLREKLVFSILNSKDSSEFERFWALWIIGEMRIDDGIPYLIKEIKNKAPNNQYINNQSIAVWSLSKFEEKRWTPVILSVIQKKNPYIQEASALAIGHLKDYRIAQFFLDLLYRKRNINSPYLKIGLLWSLTQMNVKTSRPYIYSNDFLKEVDWVRVQGLWSLYRLGEKKIPNTVLITLYDKSVYIRQVALLVVDKIDDKTIAPNLYKLLKDKSSKIIIRVMDLYSRWSYKKASMGIIPLLNDSRYSVVRKSIISLGKLKSNTAVIPLINLLNKDKISKPLKIYAVRSLIRIADKKAFDSLHDFYINEVYKKTNNMNGKIQTNNDKIQSKTDKKPSKNNKTRDKLLSLPIHKNNNRTINKKIKDPTKYPPFSKIIIALANIKQLYNLFKSPKEEIKLSAISSIPHFKKKIKDFKFLIDIMKENPTKIQTEIIKVIGIIKYKKALSLLQYIVFKSKKMNKQLHIEAIYSIGKIQVRKVSNNLRELAESLDQDISLAAIESLGYLGDKKAIPTLTSMFRYNRKTKIRTVIILSLITLGITEDKYIKTLVEILKDSPKDVEEYLKGFFKRNSPEYRDKLKKKILTLVREDNKNIIIKVFTPKKNKNTQKK